MISDHLGVITCWGNGKAKKQTNKPKNQGAQQQIHYKKTV